MAFKAIEMSDSTVYVSPFDPAVDREALCDKEIESDPELSGRTDMDHEAKREVAFMRFQMRFVTECGKSPSKSRKMLVFKDGEQPTEFVIGVIPSSELNRILDESRFLYHGGDGDDTKSQAWVNQRHWRAFIASLRDIKNWQGNGKIPTRKVGDVDYVDPNWIHSTFVRGLRDVAIQVGAVALGWQNVTEDEAKN